MRHTRKVTSAAIAAIATLGLLLTGCSSSPAPSSSESATESSTPEGTMPTNAELHLALNSPPASWMVGNWSGGDSTMALSVYDNLVYTDPDGNLIPGIAEEWAYSDDRKVLTFKLRSDAGSFTNGTKVDSSAVAASLEASRVGPSTANNFASVESIEAPDPTTVIITLKEPDAGLLPVLTAIQGIIGAPEVLTAESSQLEPVGSGPYILDAASTTVGSSYTLVKNADHWNAESYPFSKVTFTVIQDPTAVQNALQSGQLTYAGVPSADVAKQFDASKYTTGNNKPNTVGALWIIDREGSIVPALADVRVRQAINMAIDRQGIAAAINPGSNQATTQIFNPTSEAYDQALDSYYTHNIEGAKKLMAEAGYADGFELTMPSTPASITYEPLIGQALADIGITVTWDSISFQDLYSKVFGGNYGMYFFFNGFGAGMAADYNAVNGGIFNPFQLTDPSLEALVDTANSSPEAEQGAAFRKVNQHLVEEAYFAPVTNISGFYVHSNDVEYTPPAIIGQTLRPWTPALVN